MIDNLQSSGRRSPAKGAALALGMLMMAGSGMALAIPSIPEGDNIRFNFQGYDEATAPYTRGCGALGSPSASDCDLAAGSPARNSYPVTDPVSGTGQEDTWGVGFIDSIDADSTGNLYQYGDNGEFITGFFYGLHDGLVDRGLFSTSTFSYGGVLELYLDTNNDLATVPSPQSRTALDEFTGATEGTLLLRLLFVGGTDTLVPDSTLVGNFGNSSFGGGSNALFEVDGGLWADLFDDPNNVDFELDVSFRCGPLAINVSCQPNKTNPNLFALEVSGSFRGITQQVTIPEPAPLALISLGLIGLAGLSRYRRV